tara:strand:- start:22719 stop:23879 length:1161 start_codon:yes stop_codon:yes gene_type:complete
MKKYILFLSALVFLLQACSSDEGMLTPSNIDENRAIVLADMSKPLVKRLVNDFNSGLLYEYDANLDFRYTSEGISETQKWNGIKIPTIKEDRFTDRNGNVVDLFDYVISFPNKNVVVKTYQEHVDASLQFLDTTLFSYFKSNSKVANLFPNKMLIASKVSATTETSVEALTESDSRVSSSTGNKALRSVYNRNSIVFNGSLKDVAPRYEKFKKDNFYVFLVRMMDLNDLYDEFPRELFEEKRQYYGDTIGAVYGSNSPYRTSPRIAHSWYHELGFLDSNYLTKNEVRYSYDSSTRTYINPTVRSSSGFGTRRYIYPKHMFPSNKKEEIKIFLNELIHRKAASTRYIVGFDDLPNKLRGYLRETADVFISWGINLRAFNPEIESLYK